MFDFVQFKSHFINIYLTVQVYCHMHISQHSNEIQCALALSQHQSINYN